MPLRVGEAWGDSGKAGDWPLPGEPHFATSRAYELLLRDLGRYVNDEVAGRSFLIAGHRGAGKTATVTQAIRRLRNEILAGSTGTRISIGRRNRLQRPLMVKLVGQSLIAPLPQPAAEEKKNKEGQAGSAAADVEAEPHDPVASALGHLTIALYRALAAEVAWSYAMQAGEGGAEAAADRRELAAKLELELDSITEPATLPEFWERLGCLQTGLLWPRAATARLEEAGIVGQGLREVVALTTAAQAFQVCSGTVKYSVDREDSDGTETTRKSSLDVKDLVNRLGAVGAGALAGSVAGASGGAPAGVGIGLVVWLLSGAALSWTSSRTRKSSRTLKYSFLPDRTVGSLDRDLPVVIERIRDAGLAPVFVIDELDKLENAPATIAEIIHRLKHLVADYGFFCFLTGRDYFEQVERKIAREPYPNEHTYFSERVLILNRAQDLFVFLTGLIVNDPEDSSHALRTAVFALLVMYRSKMNFSDIEREVARLTGPDRALICSDDELQAAGRFRLAATIQIAINRVLAMPEAVERIESDPIFAQLALDALYYVPRELEDDSDTTLDISERAIESALRKRMGLPPRAPGGAPNEADAPIGGPELRQLAAMVRGLATYLCDFGALKAELEAEAYKAEMEGRPSNARLLADIVLVEKGRLLVPLGSGQRQRYRFVLNELAREIPDRVETKAEAEVDTAATVTAKPARPTDRGRSGVKLSKAGAAPPPPDRVQLGLDFMEAIVALLGKVGLGFGDLTDNDLLPATLSQRFFETALTDLRAANASRDNPDLAERAVNGYLPFAAAFDQRGNDLAQALVLFARARSTTDNAAAGVFARVSRYFDPSGAPLVPDHLQVNRPWVQLSGKAGAVREFTRTYETWLPKAHAGMEELRLEPAFLWDYWKAEVESYVAAGPMFRKPSRPRLEDIVFAASDTAPGNLFRLYLSRMDQFDWSSAALAGLGEDGAVKTPAWLLFAGLHFLQFGRGLLNELKKKQSLATSDFALVNRIVAATPVGRKGLLKIYSDRDGTRRRQEIEPGTPVLLVGRSVYEKYMNALAMLAECGAFAGGEIEDG
jgi:hypothetical protein